MNPLDLATLYIDTATRYQVDTEATEITDEMLANAAARVGALAMAVKTLEEVPYTDFAIAQKRIEARRLLANARTTLERMTRRTQPRLL